jgi:hypothetical protein
MIHDFFDEKEHSSVNEELWGFIKPPKPFWKLNPKMVTLFRQLKATSELAFRITVVVPHPSGASFESYNSFCRIQARAEKLVSHGMADDMPRHLKLEYELVSGDSKWTYQTDASHIQLHSFHSLWFQLCRVTDGSDIQNLHTTTTKGRMVAFYSSHISLTQQLLDLFKSRFFYLYSLRPLSSSVHSLEHFRSKQ